MEMPISSPAFFQDKPLPKETNLLGWAALVHTFSLRAPVRQLSCVSDHHIRGNRRKEGAWTIYDKRYASEPSLSGHLGFALKHENIDLLILKRLFDHVPANEIANIVKATPTGVAARRIWFFYETLTGRVLDLEDAPQVAAVDALDRGKYITCPPKLSPRHRVRDNLLGTGALCPIIRRTEKLSAFMAMDLAGAAQNTIGSVSQQLVARAASFLLLADSRASFEIEGERPPHNRLARWGRAVLEAGKRPLNQTEIYRLHGILIDDDRFTRIGYRNDGVFLGERDHNNDPLPEFIGARPDDVPDLMLALNACNNRLRRSDVDAVVQAAALAFGFVYIHPLADGNGRLHRCLVHHVLAERKFTPPGIVFPVSSAMLDRIDSYREALQGHSGPLMRFIEWRPTAEKNVEVLNETADLYRYYDCTDEAEFLYSCVRRTVEIDLPNEIDHLTRNDAAMNGIMNLIEMPDRLAQNLITFIRQNDGRLGQKRRMGEFAALSEDEVKRVEQIVYEAFGGADL